MYSDFFKDSSSPILIRLFKFVFTFEVRYMKLKPIVAVASGDLSRRHVASLFEFYCH